jgi:hypothetical protein
MISMNHSRLFLFKISGALALVIITSACTSTLAKRAQRADGLLGFIFDSPGPDIVPVERVSRDGGRVTTAHATAAGNELRVAGIVRKADIVQPPIGAHIDVFVVDAKGRVTAGVATDYFPRPLRHSSSRYGPANSHYSVLLPAIPAAGSTVRVVFHGISQSQCELSAGT